MTSLPEDNLNKLNPPSTFDVPESSKGKKDKKKTPIQEKTSNLVPKSLAGADQPVQPRRGPRGRFLGGPRARRASTGSETSDSDSALASPSPAGKSPAGSPPRFSMIDIAQAELEKDNKEKSSTPEKTNGLASLKIRITEPEGQMPILEEPGLNLDSLNLDLVKQDSLGPSQPSPHEMRRGSNENISPGNPNITAPPGKNVRFSDSPTLDSTNSALSPNLSPAPTPDKASGSSESLNSFSINRSATPPPPSPIPQKTEPNSSRSLDHLRNRSSNASFRGTENDILLLKGELMSTGASFLKYGEELPKDGTYQFMGLAINGRPLSFLKPVDSKDDPSHLWLTSALIELRDGKIVKISSEGMPLDYERFAGVVSRLTKERAISIDTDNCEIVFQSKDETIRFSPPQSNSFISEASLGTNAGALDSKQAIDHAHQVTSRLVVSGLFHFPYFDVNAKEHRYVVRGSNPGEFMIVTPEEMKKILRNDDDFRESHEVAYNAGRIPKNAGRYQFMRGGGRKDYLVPENEATSSSLGVAHTVIEVNNEGKVNFITNNTRKSDLSETLENLRKIKKQGAVADNCQIKLLGPKNKEKNFDDIDKAIAFLEGILKRARDKA